MNLTLEFLRIVGSPFEPEQVSAKVRMKRAMKINRLYSYSVKNRMQFHFLDRIDPHVGTELHGIYMAECSRLVDTYNAIGRASKTLACADVNYAIMKTIRPYRSTTVDIDIVAFGSNLDFQGGKKALIASGYTMLGEGPQSATIQDPEIDMKVDLYKEIAVSHIIYMDKQKLAQHLRRVELPNGEQVTLLSPEADLATVLAHSIIKEHMYTLSEFYTFIHYLPQIDIRRFLNLLRESNITVSSRAHATITAILHKEAFGTVPQPLRAILDQLGTDMLESLRVRENGLKMPYKYHPLTVAGSLLEIARSGKSRKSIGLQILRMLRPSFTKQFTKLLLDHIMRETY